MKVLHVIPSLGPARGGPSFLLPMLATGLARSGVEVHVVTTDDNGAGRLRVPYDVPTHEHAVTYRYFRRQTHFYTLSLSLNRWLARHVSDYQLVHIHALFSFPCVSAAYWARRRRVPYIVRPLGTLNRWGMQNRRRWLKKVSSRFIESRILARAAAIHYTSEQEWIEAGTLGRSSRMEIIPNAIEEGPLVRGRFRANHPELKESYIVLFLSRFDAKKGLDLLLPAFREVRAQIPTAMLVLAGSGDAGTVARVQSECCRLGIASSVLLVGFLEGVDKHAALQDADVFVLPSYSENFGIAAAEAMGAGVPVVISDQVAIHEEVAQANAGLVIPCSIEPTAKAIVRLLGDAPLRAELGRNGKSLALRCYSQEALGKRVLRLYEEVTAQPRTVQV